jgi:hypothetical protein
MPVLVLKVVYHVVCLFLFVRSKMINKTRVLEWKKHMILSFHVKRIVIGSTIILRRVILSKGRINVSNERLTILDSI